MKTKFFVSVIAVTTTLAWAQSSHADEKRVKASNVAVPNEDSYDVPAQGITEKVKPSQTYPEAASASTYQQELYEIKKAEEAERKSVRSREDYERRKGEAEREIAARKYKIEGLKLKQDQATSEVDALNTDMRSVEKDYKDTMEELANTEREANESFALSDKAKKDLDENHKKLEVSVEKLKALKENTFKSINQSLVEVQRMRASLSALEAQVENLEAQKSVYEADASQARAEWVAIKSQIEAKNADREKSLAFLAEAKEKLDAAQKDYRTAQNELAVAEKQRKDTEVQVTAESKKLELSTFAAQKSKAVAEAEKIRSEAETEKLKYYITSMKKSNEDALDAMQDSQNQVMESRLAMETTKAELAGEMAGGQRAKSKHDQSTARIRGLAAVAESSDMIEGGKPWFVTKACDIVKRMTADPKKKSVIGKVSKGQKIVGSTTSGPWVKILNASGSAAFVSSECGTFQE